MSRHWLAMGAALLLSVIGTAIAQRLAHRIGFVDHPGPRKIHLHPMPLLGGLAIAAAVLVAVLYAIDEAIRIQVLAILSAAGLLVLVGLLDDRGLLHHQVKFLLAIPASSAILLVAGIHTEVFASLFAGPPGLLAAADHALTVLWMLGITAAFSILDHMDGLCAGAAAIAAAFFLWIAVQGGQTLVAPLAAALLGAAIGFLFWNFHPASIFMGDAGALFLGFMTATLGLKIRLPEVAPTTSWMVPVLILVVPILDTTLVTVSRLRRGLIPNISPGKDHAAHRLLNLGLGQRGAVLVLWGLGVLGGLLGIAVTALPVPAAFVLAFAVALGAIASIVWLERLPFEPQAGVTWRRQRGP